MLRNPLYPKAPKQILRIRFFIKTPPIFGFKWKYPNHYDFKLRIQWVAQNLKDKLDTSTI